MISTEFTFTGILLEYPSFGPAIKSIYGTIIPKMIDRGVFKSCINNKEIDAYHLDITKFQYNEHPVTDYKMLNPQHAMDSVEKMDIIQNCVVWKI